MPDDDSVGSPPLDVKSEVLALELPALEQIQRTARRAFFRKLLIVQSRATAVPTSKKFEAGPLRGKSYAAAEDIVEHVRKLLLDAGLVLTQSLDLVQDTIHDLAKPGDPPKRTFRSEVRVTFYLTDADTGHTETYVFAGVSNDGNDFGPKQAHTSARSRFLLSLIASYSTNDDLPPAHVHGFDDPASSGSAPSASSGSPAAASSSRPAPRPPTREEELASLKSEAAELRGRFMPHELEALVLEVGGPEDRATWDPQHYRRLLELGAGSSVTATLARLAREEPALDAQHQRLEALLGRADGMTERAHIEAARASGWSWALDDWIQKLQKRGAEDG